MLEWCFIGRIPFSQYCIHFVFFSVINVWFLNRRKQNSGPNYEEVKPSFRSTQTSLITLVLPILVPRLHEGSQPFSSHHRTCGYVFAFKTP